MFESEPYFTISTKISKRADEPHTLDFSVSCDKYDTDSREDAPGETVGRLEGFLLQPGYLPDSFEDQAYFDRFDDRSAHAAEAFEILVERKALIAKTLQVDTDDLEMAGAVALLERAEVEPESRGRHLTQRLMREARHILGRPGLLVILKAHPDGDEISNEQCRKLGDYYCSDSRLGFRPISRRSLPGWLVALWEEPVCCDGDERFWLEER
ncbi:hypothetical protein [uncultured Roseibium sp.]|uniref:hypothetical protein n=1 Tax=uncultured Roseibium sp. TaxID=1936171 RepID=UPI003217E027